MELIDVTARFNSQGEMTPLAFTWKGISFTVDSTGRRWEDERGQHILVIIPGGRTFELLYTTLEKAWYLIPISLGPLMV
jgi:hypothetical protein